ncbi:MAG: hypothetical protein KH353_02750 [Clostridium sp.]|nr:hypothetical protein [Clostridium sp.]
MRKMRKMTVAVVLAASVTALASGCGKEEIQETSMPESTVSQTEESSSQTTAPEDSESEKQRGEVSVMTGTVLDAAMNSIVIQNEEYPQGLIFSKENSAAGFSEGLTLDMNVTLFYTGETDGEDTTKAEVVLVRESRDSDSTLTAGSVSGTVSEVTSEALIIEPESGEKVSVARGHEVLETEKEPEAGDQLTIYYSCPGGDESVKEAELIR